MAPKKSDPSLATRGQCCRRALVLSLTTLAVALAAAVPALANGPVTPFNLNGSWLLLIHHCNSAPFRLDGKVEITGWTTTGVSFTEAISVERPGSHQVGDYVVTSSTGYENSEGDVQLTFLGRTSETDVIGGTYSLKTTRNGPHTLVMSRQVPCPNGHGQDTVTMTNDHAQ